MRLTCNSIVNSLHNIKTFNDMQRAFDQLDNLIFYSLFDTHCSVNILDSKQYKKVYVRLCNESKYTKDGEEKQSKNFVLYTVNAAEELVKIFGDVVNLAKQYRGVRLISKLLFFREFYIKLEINRTQMSTTRPSPLPSRSTFPMASSSTLLTQCSQVYKTPQAPCLLDSNSADPLEQLRQEVGLSSDNLLGTP